MIAARLETVPQALRSVSSSSSSRDQDSAGNFDDVLAGESQIKNDGPQDKRPELKNSPSQGIRSEWFSFQSWKGEALDEKDQAEVDENQGQAGGQLQDENGQRNLDLPFGHGSQFSPIPAALSCLRANNEGDEGQIRPTQEFHSFPMRRNLQRDSSSNSAGLDHPDLAEPGFVEIRHVSHATHYSVPGDPIRQISQNVMSLFGEPDLVPSLPGQNESSSAPLKVLNVLLEPETLGSVTLRMKLSGNQLSIRVEVAEPSTLEMIRQDQERLQQSLKSNEIELERLEIRAATPDVSDSVLHSDGSSRSDSDRRAGSDIFSGEGKGRDDRPKQDQDRKSPHAPNQIADDLHNYRGGLYL